MAEQDTLDAIATAIDSAQSFVVAAGAGSGKTRALVESVRGLLVRNRDAYESAHKGVVCITYTNVAKDEILERLNHDPLVQVGTIHEFLWQLIAPFQTELKQKMVELNAVNQKNPVPDLDVILRKQAVTYGQYGRHFDRGELHHDDVLEIAASLFATYPKIVRLAADRFPIIFVDEYQDTSEKVVNLLLDYFVKHPRRPVVGFFGDEMQQIYDDGTTGLTKRGDLKTITKLENYRCSVKVIEVLNRLRSDIQQCPAGGNVPGDTHLFQAATSSNRAYRFALERLSGEGWTAENTKVLMLTQKGIARENGYIDLLNAYGKRGSYANDRLMKLDDEFSQFFALIEALASSYEAKQYSAFLETLGLTGMRIRKHADKVAISSEMTALETVRRTGSISDVLQFVDKSALIGLPRRVRDFQNQLASDPARDDDSVARRRGFFEALMAVPYAQVINFIRHVDALTPFSTQHGVKGAEFPNVLVIVDDTLWTKYKLGAVLAGGEKNQDRYERSLRLLYVCFSRARKGLALLYLGTFDGGEILGAKALLGVDRVETLTS